MPPIPDWSMSGIIPPIRPGVLGFDPDRSPYEADLLEVIQKFATSPERARIISGFLRYRAAWHAAGVTQGIQWLDGSFFENIEDLESRPPNDMDVVTFFNLPAGATQATLFPVIQPLLQNATAKATFSVDAYGFPLGGPYNERAIRNTTYWYSMWSHQRSGVWKGFLQVNLDPSEDAACTAFLQHKVAGGFT